MLLDPRLPQLEVIKPDKDNPARKSKCRMYVCDLAGAEPASDIYSAVYEQKRSTAADGGFEYKLVGADPDQRKTKTLQDQGKKINLSLTEMAQFFLKMAKASKAKKLGPGASIPGCNSYFLNKYLKVGINHSPAIVPNHDAVTPPATFFPKGYNAEGQDLSFLRDPAGGRIPPLHDLHTQFCRQCVSCEASPQEVRRSRRWH